MNHDPYTSGKDKSGSSLLTVQDLQDFKFFLEEAAKRFPTKQAFAREIGITPGRFSRLLAGEFSLEVVNCLRLAKITGEPPSIVLRLAGKGEIASLIEDLYGTAPTQEPPLSPAMQRALRVPEVAAAVDILMDLPTDETRAALLGMLSEAAKLAGKTPATRRTGAHGPATPGGVRTTVERGRRR